MNIPQVVVVGSVNMDLVVRAPRFAQPGETLLGSAFASVAGGKGANQAVAARRMGAEVAMVGRVGEDPLGESLLKGLADEGIDTAHVLTTREEPSGVALITVADGGENTIVVVPGANGRLGAGDVDAAKDTIAGARILLVQLEVPLAAVERAVSLAHAAGIVVVLNAAPARPLPPELLARVDYLVVNETEARLVGGGARRVVVTLGAAGSKLLDAAGPVAAALAFAVRPVDTTAAGDAFVGAFAVALANGRPAAEALRWGNAAGALATTIHGAQPSLPQRAAVEALIDG